MSEWITDRLPTEEDANNAFVYNCRGRMVLLGYIGIGDAWKPIPKCEPYTEPLRWEIMTPEDQYYVKGPYAVYLYIGGKVADQIPTREAAERIAKIYMEARS